MNHFDHFSILAPYYDRLIPVGSREVLLEMLELLPENLVLDAGGGTGRIAQILQTYTRQIVVADLSLGMLRQTQLKGSLHAVQTPSEALPFGSGIFDRIVMVDAFHHVIDQTGTARELYRVLKPGGRMVIEEPDIRTTAVKLIALFEKVFLMRSHFLSPVRIANLFNHQNNPENIVIKTEQEIAWIVVTKGSQ